MGTYYGEVDVVAGFLIETVRLRGSRRGLREHWETEAYPVVDGRPDRSEQARALRIVVDGPLQAESAHRRAIRRAQAGTLKAGEWALMDRKEAGRVVAEDRA